MEHLMKSSLFLPFFFWSHHFFTILRDFILLNLNVALFFGITSISLHKFMEMWNVLDKLTNVYSHHFFWSLTMTSSDPIYSFSTYTDTFISCIRQYWIVYALHIMQYSWFTVFHTLMATKSFIPVAEIYMVLRIVFCLFPNHKILFRF